MVPISQHVWPSAMRGFCYESSMVCTRAMGQGSGPHESAAESVAGLLTRSASARHQ